jgi:hypothetical protein
MAFRVIVVLIALFAADACLWHRKSTRVAMQTARGFASDFNYRVARHLQPMPRK